MSANLVVDLFNTCQMMPSLPGAAALSPSGFFDGLSGVLVGNSVDLINADTFCNVYVAGNSVTSGPLRVGVQCSDTDTSGLYTDPTSGLQIMPTNFSSGGWLIIGQSGATPGIFNPGDSTSGQFFLSGFLAAAAFLRPQRFARLILGSGFQDGPLQAGFISQYRTVGSGGGFSFSPSSGAVNV